MYHQARVNITIIRNSCFLSYYNYKPHKDTWSILNLYDLHQEWRCVSKIWLHLDYFYSVYYAVYLFRHENGSIRFQSELFMGKEHKNNIHYFNAKDLTNVTLGGMKQFSILFKPVFHLKCNINFPNQHPYF